VSAVDLTVNVETQTDEKYVNSIVLNASLGDMEGIIKFSQERLVSVDFNTTVQSCIFASEQTRVVDKTMVRVLAWYDNEWSFSCRLADTAHQLINLGVSK
jgi:glyceraldehyde 3-phosphate dehydrogenase